MTHTSHPVKCVHRLNYCEQCNIVHCSECKEEWKKEYTNLTYTTNNPWSGTVGVSTTPGYETIILNHNH